MSKRALFLLLLFVAAAFASETAATDRTPLAVVSGAVKQMPAGDTVGVLHGGTSQSAYTDGQVLIGDTLTGGLDKSTLAAGAGITITNGHGSATITGAPNHPGYVAGRYYLSPFYSPNASQVIATNIIIAEPIYIPSTTTFSELSIFITNPGGAGTLARLGVYANAGGVPGAIEFDAGTVRLDVTGSSATSGSFTLSPGWHYLAYVGNGSEVAERSNVPPESVWIFGTTSQTDSVVTIATNLTYPVSALPLTFPTPITYQTGGTTLVIYIRK